MWRTPKRRRVAPRRHPLSAGRRNCNDAGICNEARRPRDRHPPEEPLRLHARITALSFEEARHRVQESSTAGTAGDDDDLTRALEASARVAAAEERHREDLRRALAASRDVAVAEERRRAQCTTADDEVEYARHVHIGETPVPPGHVRVRVPPGMGPGSEAAFTAPDGRVMRAVIPAGRRRIPSSTYDCHRDAASRRLHPRHRRRRPWRKRVPTRRVAEMEVT